MKKYVTILIALIMVFAFCACSSKAGTAESSNGSTHNTDGASATSSKTGNESDTSVDIPSKLPSSTNSSHNQESQNSKILVAYFSATGNTKGVAQKLADGLGADLYEIKPEKPYTDEDLNYNNDDSRSSKEMNDDNVRPAISGTVTNMEQYDVVLIGYPIWWGEAPRIMSTFIESYDFSNKTLVAFCTSGSSGFGNSDKALRSAASKAKWLDGHRFSTGASADDVLAWANGLGMK